VDPEADPCFGSYGQLGPAARHLLDLYLPLCIGDNAEILVIAHLGQSLDGQDAANNETAQYLNFEKGKWYKVRLRVIPDKIQAWIDDDQVVNVETAGRLLRFTDSRYAESALNAAMAKHLPTAKHFQAKPMTLREIFVALARTYRLNGLVAQS